MSQEALWTTFKTWTLGYALARGYATPEPSSIGLWMPVRLPQQLGRHILRGFDEAEYSRLVRETTQPGVYIEVCAPREYVKEILPPGWTVLDHAYLMTSELRASDRAKFTSSYAISWIDGRSVIRAEVTSSDGEIAASGRCGMVGTTAVFDQIVTQEAHRRRGLGSAVMTTLSQRAIERGAKTGVLIATSDGRALYTTLGWSIQSEVTCVTSPPRG